MTRAAQYSVRIPSEIGCFYDPGIRTMSSRRGPWSNGNKYGAKKTVVDGITFDSKAEATRYQTLKLLEKAGKLADLKVHHRWELHAPNDEVLGQYESDFHYWPVEGGRLQSMVIEDVKGVRTPLYRWKKKHFEAEYGTKITEITKGKRGGNRHAQRDLETRP